MSIRISPATFVFKGPLTSRLVRRMRIENNGHRFLAFKIKTTSPKSYGVLPTNGIISPNSEQVILVKKFAIKQEPDITLKFNDKFMVLIAYVDIADIKKSIDSMWQQIETRPDQAIKSVLIPCLYQGTVTDTSSISSSPAVFEITKYKDKMAAADRLVQQIADQPTLFDFATILVIIIFNICLWWFC